MLEAAEKEASRSFLCLWFVVSQSVMPVELFVYLAEQNALLCGEDVCLCMCARVRVGFDKLLLSLLLLKKREEKIDQTSSVRNRT